MHPGKPCLRVKYRTPRLYVMLLTGGLNISLPYIRFCLTECTIKRSLIMSRTNAPLLCNRLQWSRRGRLGCRFNTHDLTCPSAFREVINGRWWHHKNPNIASEPGHKICVCMDGVCVVYPVRRSRAAEELSRQCPGQGTSCETGGCCETEVPWYRDNELCYHA